MHLNVPFTRWQPSYSGLVLLNVIYRIFQFGVALRCPVSKFITHTASHFVFLFLLALATFGLEDVFYGLEIGPDHDEITFELRLQSRLRPMRTSITMVQYTIIAWVIGQYTGTVTSWLNSSATGSCGCDFKCVNFKHSLGNGILSIKKTTLEWMSGDSG